MTVVSRYEVRQRVVTEPMQNQFTVPPQTYALFDVARLRLRCVVCRFADLKILNVSPCIEQLRYPMRSLASSRPCLVRLSRISKLRQNRRVSTVRRFLQGRNART
jgi:hypothetical protein